MATETISDLMMRKLSERYPAVRKNLTDLMIQFETDNPTWSRSQADMRRDFYGATDTETEADAAMRYWTDLVP